MKATRARLAELTQQAAAAPAPTTPIAAARLEKLHQEIALLTHRVRSADLERRALERELLYSSEAIELLNAALGPVADGLRRMPKFLSARLHGQSMGEIENTLTEEANRLLALGNYGLKTAKSKTSREL